MRQTALELVNYVMGDDGDPVSTIGETEDSEIALRVVNRAYLKLEEDINWFYRRVITKLSTAADTATTWNATTYPNLAYVMAIPDNVENIINVYYESDSSKSTKKHVTYMPPGEFQFRIISKDGFKTDRDPLYYTCWDETYLVFDGVNTSNESQLSEGNSEILCHKFGGTDLVNDTDTLDMPNRFFTALINKAMQYYAEEVLKNFGLADRKKAEYIDSRNKLIKWGHKNVGKVPYWNSFDWSRRLPSAPGANKRVVEA